MITYFPYLGGRGEARRSNYKREDQLIVFGNMNRICILPLCENCIILNYDELVHSAFQVYYVRLLSCIFILLIFQSLISNLTKNLILST